MKTIVIVNDNLGRDLVRAFIESRPNVAGSTERRGREVEALLSSPHLPSTLLPRRLRRMLEEEGSDTFTVDMLQAFGTLKEFDTLRRDPFVVFMEPPAVDRRILNQLALFSLMSSPEAGLDEWLARHPQLCHRGPIPAAAKWEIRDKLDQANINERVLFPGLDGLSRWLTRYYTTVIGDW